MIPYGRQNINQADIDAVVAVLQSDFLTQGPKVPSFEAALAEYCGTKHALAVNSATSALHIACLSLGLGPGNFLWTSPISFVASANCALYCGAEIDFVDIDPQTLNLSPSTLAEKLEKAKQDNKLPKIVVAVHLCGEPCNMAEIYALSKKYGFAIIEDASHAIGARYQSQMVGSCQYSDITVFSFHPVKIITTAEGGMALTNRDDLAEKMALLRSHGITRESHLMTKQTEGEWYYQQLDLGFNYRMTELQAALGISQLQRLEEFIVRRHLLAERYDNLLSDLPIRCQIRNTKNRSALHLYPIRISPESGKTRTQVFDSLRKNGVGVNVHYIPIHIQPYYQKNFHFKIGSFPQAEQYYAEAISLPLYADLSKSDQDKVIATLRNSLL